jgi:hypothetical protein
MGTGTHTEKIRSASPFLAPGACYITFNRDQLRRSEPIPADLVASRQLIRNIAEDMRDCATDYTPWVLLCNRAIDAENFVREIIASGDGGFEDQRDEEERLVELTRLPLGEHYFKILMAGKYLADTETVEPYRLRPMAQVYFDVRHSARFNHYSAQYFKSPPWLRPNEAEPFPFEVFNEMIDAIRTEAKARGLNRLEQLNTSQAEQRLGAMMRYVRWCFRKRRRIFVIRMDLYYRTEFAGKVSIEQAKEHHALFVNRLRALKDVQTDLIGGIWKLEWTERKGHHVHWVFMFDGSLVQNAWKWSDLIDEQWRNAVPLDGGYTHCGNRDQHKHVGTGMIHLDNEPEKFGIFEKEVIGYLAKKDQVLCLKISAGTRAWGRFTPGGKRTSKAGRPSKSRAVQSE